jgi:hypothetical protein
VPLYEFVLRFRDRDEIRVGDRNGYQAGDEIVIAGRRFLVLGHEPPENPNADERLVLKPAPMRFAANAAIAVAASSARESSTSVVASSRRSAPMP